MTQQQSNAPAAERELFSSRFGVVMTMIGVAVGLGNIWRFPYMVGEFGGAAFVLFYVVAVMAIGVPALMAEWALGRYTRRGPVGALAASGMPFGRQAGWFFFVVVTAAMGYYSAVIGWVVYHAFAELVGAAGAQLRGGDILPPDTGFAPRSFVLQLVCTALVVGCCAITARRGVRDGIERASRFLMPLLFFVLLVLVVRAVTLPNAGEGVRWYLMKFELGDLTPKVMLAAMGQVFFSLSLGGTFMVVYGSYLNSDENLGRNAALTVTGDTVAGLLAGLAIFPAVFSLGLEPTSGPGLLFATLPGVFASIPLGWVFGTLFFAGLAGGAFLSAVAALEVLAAALADNLGMPRSKAIPLMATAVFLCSLPPTLNMSIFLKWDLIFGSGMQVLGSLLAVVALGWCVNRSAALHELGANGTPAPPWLYLWVRYAIPAMILGVGVWWLLTSVLGTVSGV